MKMSRARLLSASVVVAFLVGTAVVSTGFQQGVSADDIPGDAIPITSCNFDADEEGGYYYLIADLTCGGDENGLVIGANGITIHGNGFKITGNKSTCETVTETDPQYACCGILNSGYDDVTVKNIEIANFCTGIALHGTALDRISNNTIDNCTVHDNGVDIGVSLTHGIHMTYVWDSQVVNNEIYNQKGTGTACGDGGNGVFMYSGGSNLIENNNMHDNAKAGFFSKMKPKDVAISRNEVTGNAQGGIVLRCKLCSMFNITDNYVASNYGAGVYVGGPGNTLQDNVITGNRAPPSPRGDEAADNPNGIRISREADDTTLKANTTTGNDAADIYIREDLVRCEMADNAFGTYQGLEEVSGKRVQAGNPEIPSGTSITIAELIGMILGLVALVFVGYGFSRRRKRMQ